MTGPWIPVSLPDPKPIPTSEPGVLDRIKTPTRPWTSVTPTGPPPRPVLGLRHPPVGSRTPETRRSHPDYELRYLGQTKTPPKPLTQTLRVRPQSLTSPTGPWFTRISEPIVLIRTQDPDVILPDLYLRQPPTDYKSWHPHRTVIPSWLRSPTSPIGPRLPSDFAPQWSRRDLLVLFFYRVLYLDFVFLYFFNSFLYFISSFLVL